MAAETEKFLTQIASGEVSPAQGMDALQAAVTKVVKDAGYLK